MVCESLEDVCKDQWLDVGYDLSLAGGKICYVKTGPNMYLALSGAKRAAAYMKCLEICPHNPHVKNFAGFQATVFDQSIERDEEALIWVN